MRALELSLQRLESSASPSPAGTEDDGDKPFLTIAELSDEFGLTLRALRFYESRGFLSPMRRGAVRSYHQADRVRLAFVLEAKSLGFTLREIGDLVAVGAAAPGPLKLSRHQCVEQITLLERQKREIETALGKLRQLYSGHYLRQIERGEFDNP